MSSSSARAWRVCAPPSTLAARGARVMRPRSEGRARRTRYRLHRSTDRRAGRQRPARDARLLPRDLCVPAADRHRRSCARAAGPRGRLRGSRGSAKPASLPGLPPPLNFAAGLLDWKAVGGAIGWRPCGSLVQSARHRQSKEQRAKGRRPRALPRRRARRWTNGSSTTGRPRASGRCCGSRSRLRRSISRCAWRPRRRSLRCSPRCSAAGRGTRRWRCRHARSTSSTPSRRARFIEARGGEVRIGCAARDHLDDGRVGHVEARGDRLDAGRSWQRFRGTCWPTCSRATPRPSSEFAARPPRPSHRRSRA